MLFESGDLSTEEQAAAVVDVLPVLDELVLALRKAGGEKASLFDALLTDPDRLSSAQAIPGDLLFPGDLLLGEATLAEWSYPRPGDRFFYLEGRGRSVLFGELDAITADLSRTASQSPALNPDFVCGLGANVQRLREFGAWVSQAYTIPEPLQHERLYTLPGWC